MDLPLGFLLLGLFNQNLKFLFVSIRGNGISEAQKCTFVATIPLGYDTNEYLYIFPQETNWSVSLNDPSKDGLIPCVRLNGTSDLGWEGFAKELILEFSTVQWYDYTKIQARMMRYLDGKCLAIII